MSYNFFQRLFGIDKSNNKADELIKRIEDFERKASSGNTSELIKELTGKVIDLQKSVALQKTEIVNDDVFVKENFSFNLPDSLNLSDNLFSFEITDKVAIRNKKKIDTDVDSFLRNLGSSVPEIASNGVLANSYKFVFPKGVSGAIMKLPLGQGTAITGKEGKILKHGAYVKNLTTAAPLMAVSFAGIIIRQHYLAKINKNLDEIKADVKKLLELVFIDKEAKIQSKAAFLTEAHINFGFVQDNKEYRNAYLANIIRTNSEILELIIFYGKSLKIKDKHSNDEIKKHLEYYLGLHSLYIQGKLLELKYANEYNDTLLENLKESFATICKNRKEVLNDNFLSTIGDLYSVEDSKSNLDWLFGKKQDKEDKIQGLTQTSEYLKTVTRKHDAKLYEVILDIQDFQAHLKKPKTFLIEDGSLFDVNEITIAGILVDIANIGLQIKNDNNAK